MFAVGTAAPVAVCTATLTAGVMASPAVTLVGWDVNTTLLAVATVTLPLAALTAVHERYTAVTV
ncbi:hypothetical protein AHiyo6_05030 [Arthrobacter sp. Hiyo6]|nr:hypothetical protein AHiyo6_05030 [Arthrobacter sp. Hiyo6]